jgi:hypothetical protein
MFFSKSCHQNGVMASPKHYAAGVAQGKGGWMTVGLIWLLI